MRVLDIHPPKNVSMTATKMKNKQNVSQVITGLFDNDSSATVQGTFTNAEWATIPNAIKDALNARFDLIPNEGLKNNYRLVFGQGESITIIVEKTNEYDNYKTALNGTIIRINFAILNEKEVLMDAFHNAIRATYTDMIPPMAQVIPSRDKSWQIYCYEQRDKHITA